MNEFDDDRFFSDMLNAASGPHPDESAAYGAVLGRVRTVRRRRAAIVTGAGVACMFTALSVFALRPGADDGSLRPAATGPDGSPISTVAPDGSIPPDTGRPDRSTTTTGVRGANGGKKTTTTTAGVPSSDGTGTQVPSTGSPGTTVATTPATTPSTSGTTTPTTSTSPTSSSPSTSAPSTTVPSTSAPTTTTPPSTTTPPTTVAPVTRTFSCQGGSATVRLSSGSLTLLGTTNSAGFAVTSTETRSDRVRVQWESSSARSRLEVRPAGGGMSPTCQEETSGGGDGGGGGGGGNGGGSGGSSSGGSDDG